MARPVDGRPDCPALASDVESIAHFFAGLEIRHAFGINRDGVTRSRIPSSATATGTRRKRSEAAQLDATASSKLSNDFVEKARHNVFNVADGKTGIFGGQFIHEFGSYHGFSSLSVTNADGCVR